MFPLRQPKKDDFTVTIFVSNWSISNSWNSWRTSKDRTKKTLNDSFFFDSNWYSNGCTLFWLNWRSSRWLDRLDCRDNCDVSLFYCEDFLSSDCSLVVTNEWKSKLLSEVFPRVEKLSIQWLSSGNSYTKECLFVEVKRNIYWFYRVTVIGKQSLLV